MDVVNFSQTWDSALTIRASRPADWGAPRLLVPEAVHAASQFGNVAWYDGHVSSEKPTMPADSPYIASMKAGGTGYLTPMPSSVTRSEFTSSPSANYLYYYHKTQQILFF